MDFTLGHGILICLSLGLAFVGGMKFEYESRERELKREECCTAEEAACMDRGHNND